jgi:hypothetical protein
MCLYSCCSHHLILSIDERSEAACLMSDFSRPCLLDDMYNTLRQHSQNVSGYEGLHTRHEVQSR